MRIEPLRPQVGVNQNHQQWPRQLKWCNIEKKYTNHETHECFFRPRYENPNQGMGQQQQQVNPQHQQRAPQAYQQQGYGRAMNEIPKPVLGQQPPMPGTNLVPVNLVQGEENLLEQTMMPTTLYGEGSSMSQWINPQDQPLAPQEYHPDLDIETLLYIARNNTRGPRQNPQGERGCYNCGALDHWQKECPREKQPQFKPAPRYCEECMVTHLPIHCPKNPHNTS